jgi:hypothetical protein
MEKIERGRPTKFSDELAAELCQGVMSATPVERLCEQFSIAPAQFYFWQATKPSFAEAIAHARRVSAAAFADKAALRGEQAFENPGERGELARGAAVAVASAQWQAERRDPARWGQRSAVAIDARVTVSGKVGVTVADVLGEAMKVSE